MKLLIALASLLVVGLWGAGAASAAQLSGSIAMYSDPHDSIGEGTQQVWPQTTVAMTGNPGDLTVNATDASGNSWSLEFAAPTGQSLESGVYDHAIRAFVRGSSPGIDINGAGRGCNTDAGRFEVRDIAFDSSGNPTRLWIIFEQHCERAPAALFGEVRLGEPPAGASVQPAASLVRWPANDFGTPETVVPVQFVASQTTSLSAVSIVGSDPSDFRVSSDGCTGVVLSVGHACTVYVGFTPDGPGLRTAALNLSQTGGGSVQVPLQGWTYGGTTRLVMNSDAGDYIGQGQSYSYDPAAATLDATGTPEQFSFDVNGSNGDWWEGEFVPSQGQIFTPGSTWTNAARAPFQGTAAGMDVGGNGRGCNTVSGQFEVIAATYTPDGALKTFAVKFEQHCEGVAPALRGEFDWRLNDSTPPAPWMQSSSGASAPSSPPSSGPVTNPASATPTTPAPTTPGSPTTATPTPSTQGSKTAQSDAHRVLVSSLATLLAQQSSREHHAIALLTRTSGTRARQHALSAINRLLSMLVSARKDLSHLATTAAAHPTRTRVLRALVAWRTLLLEQRSVVRSPGLLSLTQVRALNRREAADAAASLRALGRLRKMI